MTKNSSSVSDQFELRRAEKLRREQRRADTRDVLTTPQGRRLMARILDELCHLYHTSYQIGQCATDTAFWEGERNVGLQLSAFLLEDAPRGFQQLIHERYARIQLDNEKKEVATTKGETDEHDD